MIKNAPMQFMHVHLCPFICVRLAEAVTSFTDEVPPKSWWMEEIQTALAAGSATSSLPLDDTGMIVFCGTCMGRFQQATVALLVNSVLGWRFRKQLRFVLLTLGDDAQSFYALEKVLAPAIRHGLVTLASGGQRGEAHAADRGAPDAPPWMSGESLEAVPGDLPDMPRLKYWNAPLAKNGCHEVAKFLFGNRCELMVSWDCDNLIPGNYVASCAAMMAERTDVPGACVTCRGMSSGALTGRLCFRAKDFWNIRGYDEVGTPPSSGQDVDLRERLWGVAREAGAVKARYAPTLTAAVSVGCALKNDMADPSFAHDRGWSKVTNIDPEIAAQYAKGMNQNKIWHRMASQTWSSIYAPRIAAKLWVRNVTDQAAIKPGLGCWWSVVPLKQTLRSDAAPPPPKRPHTELAGHAPEAGDAPQQTAQPAAAPGQGLSPQLPTAGQPVRPVRTVNIIMVGLKYMVAAKKTKLTYPFHCCICLVTSA